MTKQLHFFVLFAFLVGIIAPACGFAWGGKYSVIEICTAQGLESRVVDNDLDNQDQPKKSHIKEQCQFCFAQAHLKNITPVILAVADPLFDIQKTQYNHFEEIFLARVSYDYAARAPPILV